MDATMTRLDNFEDVYETLDTETQETFDAMLSRSENYAELAGEVQSYDGEDRTDLVRAAAALDESDINTSEVLGGLRFGREDYEADLKALKRSQGGL